MGHVPILDELAIVALALAEGSRMRRGDRRPVRDTSVER